MMMWFGTPRGAPYESDTERVTAPVGALCAWCGEVIGWHDDGLLIPRLGDGETHLPWHYECHMRHVIGGLNHLRGDCVCCGGTELPDPPELSPRAAARAAVDYWTAHR